MEEVVIELRDLSKKYGTFTAVNQLNLTVSKGEVFGLLGPNGAGKSTTILMMLGLTEPTSGSVSVCGLNSAKNPIEVKRKVGYLPEDVGFYDDLTGRENLVYTARLNGLTRSQAIEKADQLLAKVGLPAESDKKTGKYSRGMRQRLGLADVLIKSPEIIILDEPTLGIDPKGVKELLDLIVSLSHEEGITVLFSSHHLHQVQKVCTRVGLFVSGQLLATGDIPSLAQQLFPDKQLEIEVGFTHKEVKNGQVTSWFSNVLKNVEGIQQIKAIDNMYIIQCNTDKTSEIAHLLVQEGAQLQHLQKHEFGLDDIYYRYFEGGDNHEK